MFQVLLINHVPIGMSENVVHSPYVSIIHNARLVSYVREYSDVIVAILSGHAHSDAFRIIYHGSEYIAIDWSPTRPQVVRGTFST